MKQLKYLLLLLLFFPASLLASESYKDVYVFGDSLSDTGNLASIVPSFPSFPYYQGRFSNGLVAVEIMADRLGLPLETSLHLIGPASGNNYAVAGASAARNDAIDLNTQVAWFLANHGGVAPVETLYVMFIGGNDVRHARDTEDWGEAVKIVEEAAQTVANQIQVLAAGGAKNWLVVNAPDIGAVPETRMLAEALDMPGLPARTTTLSILYNGALKRHMQLLEESTDIEIVRFNLFKLFARIVEKAGKLGFSNATDACFLSELGEFTPGCSFGYNFDQYIYFDEIHPTARVHELVGIALSRKVQDEGHESEAKHKHKHKEKQELESADS